MVHSTSLVGDRHRGVVHVGMCCIWPSFLFAPRTINAPFSVLGPRFLMSYFSKFTHDEMTTWKNSDLPELAASFMLVSASACVEPNNSRTSHVYQTLSLKPEPVDGSVAASRLFR